MSGGYEGGEATQREIAYLNLKWFMATLLDRMERTSTWYDLSARVPFADYRIIEYVWNVPWTIKCKDGIPKSLLRCAGKGKVPEEILWRKKSPYPKTYNPEYEAILARRMREEILGYKCTDPGIFGQEEGGEVFECTKRLWKTVVQ